MRAILDAIAAQAGVPRGDDGGTLDDALARSGERAGGILMLVLDQFEEYFLYHAREDDRLRHELLPAIARPDLRARVLISLREDALASLELLEGTASSQFGNLVRLGPMTNAAAVEAITGRSPAATSTLEPGLAEHVLALLHEREPSAGTARGLGLRRPGGHRAGLPTARHEPAVGRERQRGSAELRIATLIAMGSLREIVSEHLGQAMAELTPAERGRMAGAFHYLVTPSGAKIAQPGPTWPGSPACGRTRSRLRSRSWPAATPAS